MFESDLVRGGVEIGEIAATHFDRADTKTHLAGIDAIEIDQPLQRRAQRRVVVIARFVRTARRPNGWRRQARHEEIRRAEQENAHGTHLIDQLVLGVVILDMLKIRYAEWRSGDRVPKFA